MIDLSMQMFEVKFANYFNVFYKLLWSTTDFRGIFPHLLVV